MAQLANGGFIKADPNRRLAIEAIRGDYIVSNATLRRAGIDPEQLHTPAKPTTSAEAGWFVPAGTDICPHCGDTNFNETDRLCISCNHDHPEHNTLDCEQFCRR